MTNIILLNYDPTGELEYMTELCRDSIKRYSRGEYKIHEIKNVKGFVNAVNAGLSVDGGDYFIFVANDVEIKDDNWIEKMTQENALVGWRLNDFYINGDKFPDFACFALSRNTLNKIGIMDTIYQDGYGFDDNDWTYTAKEKGVQIIDAGVILVHHENKTYSTHFSKEKEQMTERNHRIFVEKWGKKLGIT